MSKYSTKKVVKGANFVDLIRLISYYYIRCVLVEILSHNPVNRFLIWLANNVYNKMLLKLTRLLLGYSIKTHVVTRFIFLKLSLLFPVYSTCVQKGHRIQYNIADDWRWISRKLPFYLFKLHQRIKCLF